MLGSLISILCICSGDLNIYAQSPYEQQRKIVPPDKEELIVIGHSSMFRTAKILEQIYQKPVTYEGPIDLEWDGDVDLVPGAGERLVRVSKRAKFIIPDEVKPEKNKQLDAGLLEKVIEAYEKQIDGPKFKISLSKLGFHLITDQVRDKNEQFVKEKPYLDASISVPSEKMTAYEHLTKIVDAVNTSRDIKLLINYGQGYDFFWLGDIAGNIPNRQDMISGNYDKGKLQFEWGADNVIAREALIDLLEKANTTLTWHMDCDHDPHFKKICGISILPLEVNYLEPDGRKIKTYLYYNRIKEK